MKLKVGDKLPDLELFYLDQNNDVKKISILDLCKNNKTIILGMPGAFTPTCSNDHLPSFIKNKSLFENKGVDCIICVVVNDVYVAKVWGEQTGATQAGIKILADPKSEFANSLGLGFSVPALGLFNRLKRFVIIIDNNIIKNIILEQNRGACDLTSGDNILSLLK